MEVASRELGAGVGGCCSSSQQGAVISASIPAAFPQAASYGTAQAEPTASGNPEQAHCIAHCPLNSHLFFICVRLMKISSVHGAPPCKVLHKVLLKEQPQNHISSQQSKKPCFLLGAKWPELPTSLSCHGRRFLRNVSGARKDEEVSTTLSGKVRHFPSLKCLYLNKCQEVGQSEMSWLF